MNGKENEVVAWLVQYRISHHGSFLGIVVDAFGCLVGIPFGNQLKAKSIGS